MERAMGIEPMPEAWEVAAKIHRRLDWEHLSDFEENLLGKVTENDIQGGIPRTSEG